MNQPRNKPNYSLKLNIFVTLLFILSMLNLGIFVSTLTHRSITSIVTLLFFWTVLILLVPKISPMIAKIIYPIQSEQVVNLQKLLVRQNLERELARERSKVYDQIFTAMGLDPQAADFFNAPTDVIRNAKAKYIEAKKKTLNRSTNNVLVMKSESWSMTI
jgi:ABC-type transport system involved in multi-copper enzyme maturation permease subunit